MITKATKKEEEEEGWDDKGVVCNNSTLHPSFGTWRTSMHEARRCGCPIRHAPYWLERDTVETCRWRKNKRLHCLRMHKKKSTKEITKDAWRILRCFYRIAKKLGINLGKVQHTATLVMPITALETTKKRWHSCQVSLSAFVVNQPLDKSILHWRRGAVHLYLFERAGMVARGHYSIFMDVCMGWVNIGIWV